MQAESQSSMQQVVSAEQQLSEAGGRGRLQGRRGGEGSAS